MVDLAKTVKELERHYGQPAYPRSTDPFAMVLAENVAYLADDEDRRRAMELLASTVGLRPRDLAKAPLRALEKVAQAGILAPTFAKKLKECGRIAMDELGGDLRTFTAGPPAAAIRTLRKFPGIGLPAAEKIVLFAGMAPLLAPDSNALRVLGRLGLIPKTGNYNALYAKARPLVEAFRGQIGRVQTAHLLLRQHGKTLCRRTTPRCGECPLLAVCPSAPPG